MANIPQTNPDRLRKYFLDLVKINASSGNEKPVADYLKSFFSEHHLTFIEDHTGKKMGGNSGNLICRIPSRNKKSPTLAIVTHMDTVIPCEKIKPVEKNGVFYSDNTTVLGADDRAGIAETLEVINLLEETPVEHGEIELVYTVFEETFMQGSRNIDFTKIQSRYAIILDEQGAPGTIINTAPYLYTINIHCRGKSAHSGMCPETGISAVQIAGEAISRIPLGRLDFETTCNLGTIQGGYARNIIPEHVEIEAECRSLTLEKINQHVDLMKNIFINAADKYGGKVEFVIQECLAGYHVPPQHKFIEIISQAAVNCGLKARINHSGGGTDANIFNQKDITSVVLSMGYREMHSLQENISIRDLVDTVEWVLEIIRIFSKKEWKNHLT